VYPLSYLTFRAIEASRGLPLSTSLGLPTFKIVSLASLTLVTTSTSAAHSRREHHSSREHLSSRRGGKRVGRSWLNNPDRRRSAGFEARPRKK
jgi:hypothetical protein